MGKYICVVCGYVYDEAKGIPEAGIAPGTLFAELPEDWLCPLCGAPKSDFKKQGEAAPAASPPAPIQMPADMKEISPLELAAICSNLARGCEKQYLFEESARFTELAAYFKAAAAPADGADLAKLSELVEKDLETGFPSAHAVSSERGDRGALRALTWSEKVSRILKSLISRYEKEGEAMLENTGVYVCTICGFIYIGDTLPDLCPICKVANWKFEEVGGR